MSPSYPLALLGLLGGCVDVAGDHGEAVQAVTAANGVSLNGVSLNGVSLDGVSLDGVSLDGVSLNGVSLDGVRLDGVSLDGVRLSGVKLDGERQTALAIGAVFDGALSNGATLPLRIDAAMLGAGTNADVWMYGVSYASDAGWAPLCGLDAEGLPIDALAVGGTWSSATGEPGGGAYTARADAMTFACRGKSIAKCVELGYEPWTGRSAHLAACVRLLRGDYCGDGTPHTQDGNLVNLYDDIGIQTDSEKWLVEAEWTPDGAQCLRAGNTRWDLSGTRMPDCALSRVQASCGTFRNGALLIDELPSSPPDSTITTQSLRLR